MQKLEEVQENNQNRLVILQKQPSDKIDGHRSPIKYVINMFRIENDTVRPRKNHRLTINDYNPIFRVKEANHKIEIPSSIKIHNSTSNSNLTGKSSLKSFYSNLEEYFTTSSLHGLKYIGDTSISIGERLFWTCSFLCAVGFASFFISSIYEKYNRNPVIISVNPNLISLSSIPFPAITICNMNQAKKNEAENIIQSGTEVEKMLLDDFCDFNSTTTHNSSSEGTAKWDNVQKFMIRVSQSCQDMVKLCMWRDMEKNCETVFNSVLTDEGLCCTFNQLPRETIFRNPREMSDLNLTIPEEVEDWSPEHGYSPTSSFDAIPWRAQGAGTRLGLKLVLDADRNSYYCSSTDSIGFKIVLHNPIETPKMADFAFLLQPGIESRIVINPKISDATASLRNVDIAKRLCFFISERALRFYRSYTQRNCKLECQANYTLELCKCVPYYLPKSKVQKICGKKEEKCIRTAKETMDGPDDTGSNCDCLPACFELSYESTVTFGVFDEVLKIKEKILRNESVSYFMENMAILHFYFSGTQFTRNTKSEIYGFSEFLSNTGGLLGLFMGFSFLSAVEIVYYCTLRICCTLFRSKNKKQNQKVKCFQNNDTSLYPFTQ